MFCPSCDPQEIEKKLEQGKASFEFRTSTNIIGYPWNSDVKIEDNGRTIIFTTQKSGNGITIPCIKISEQDFFLDYDAVFNPELYISKPEIEGIELESKVMGLYYPLHYHDAHGNTLSQDILQNKNGPNDSSERLAFAMYHNMKILFPDYLKADFLIPVPNHFSSITPDSSAVGIAKLFSQRANKENSHIRYADILTREIATSIHKLDDEKKQFLFDTKKMYYIENPEAVENIYKIKGKTALLIDDVITKGRTVKRCMDVLYSHGIQKIFIYCTARTFNG